MPLDRSIAFRWPDGYKYDGGYTWLDPLRRALARRCEVRLTPLPHRHRFETCERALCVIRGQAHEVAFDFGDTSRIDSELAETCLVYFKMQFRGEGYPQDNVVPLGYVVADRHTYLELPQLRELRDQREYSHDVVGRFSLERSPQTNEYRKMALGLLRDAGYAAFAGPHTRLSRRDYLEEVARAKICIDLPGNGDLCFRLVEYLSVGACIIAPRHMNRLIEPLVDRRHIVYAEPDLSNLVELCDYYLEHDAERETLVRNSREYFDRWLHRDRVAEHIVATCLARASTLEEQQRIARAAVADRRTRLEQPVLIGAGSEDR